MFTRRLLLAIAASPMFLPVSAAVATVPAAHLISLATTRDLAAGAEPHGGPVGVPLVAKAMPGAAVVFPVAQVPDALAKWPSLTPRLPPRGGTAWGDADRLEWTARDAGGGAQLVEARYVTRRATRIVRYRATDAGVALLTSRMFTRVHAFAGLGVGVAVAVAIYLVARRLRRRLPVAAVPRRRPSVG